MTVRAKFYCQAVSEEGKRVVLYPVVSGSAENETFFKWTPSGSIERSVLNDAAATFFVPGQQYYVDFSLADEE